jgi:hypothetical protein
MLEDLQYELLKRFVEGHLSAPDGLRGSFISMWPHNDAQATFFHSRVPSIRFFGDESDAEILASLGLLSRSMGRGGSVTYRVLPQAIETHRQRERHVMTKVRLFISHSSRDSSLAENLIHLFRDALGLSAEEIRCTSVDGYRLSGGADTDEQLRHEIADTETFVGLLSPSSIRSTYVIFELGARWGLKKHLVPLLAPGLSASSLEGPVASLNALSCGSSSQLHQLVSELAENLDVPLRSPAAYQPWIERISQRSTVEIDDLSRKEVSGESRTQAAQANPRQAFADDSESAVRERVQKNAESDYPNDFSTQRYVVNEQLKAWGALRSFSDSAVPADIVNAILAKTASDYPDDYSTQLYVLTEQIKDWKQLNG